MRAVPGEAPTKSIERFRLASLRTHPPRVAARLTRVSVFQKQVGEMQQKRHVSIVPVCPNLSVPERLDLQGGVVGIEVRT